MKKTYRKPMISFEMYSLDMPIAVNCSPDAFGIGRELKEIGFFGDSCYDELSDDYLDIRYGDDKICYYTLAEQVFTS